MHLLILILTALLLIPAALAGILDGASQLIHGWRDLSLQVGQLAQAAQPLWAFCQPLLDLLLSLALLALAASLLVHALKFRP